MSRLLHLILAAALGALALGASLASPAESALPNESIFVSPCGFSHRASDDPIVFPGRPGAAHSHDFFGNRSTNAHSTRSSLLGQSTTCRRSSDKAGYWVPTLSKNGRPLTPVRAQFYYRQGPKPAADIEPHPAGLRVIAGNGKATEPQGLDVTSWHCGEEADGTFLRRTEVPLCATGRQLHVQIRFPDCWDGRRLDSADHQSHMAYSRPRSCPSSHPVPTPKISFNVAYPTRGGSGVTLSSGSRYSAHADFFNAWNQRSLADLVRRCINEGPVPRHDPPCAAPRR